MTVKAVVFDMDGVLLDTESVCFECWKRAGEQIGVYDSQEAYHLCVGTNVNDTRLILHERYGAAFDADDFIERTRVLFHVVESEKGLSLMPHVRECLDSLKAQGFRLAVASSTRSEAVHRQLGAAGIIGCFETITCGDTVEHSKPAPDIYLKACESLRLSPAECIAVEDSPNGVRAAVAAGMKCVMVPDQVQPTKEIRALATVVLHDLGEVPEFVTRRCLD